MIPTLLPKIELDAIARSQHRAYFEYQKNLLILKEASQCAHPATITYRNLVTAELEEAEAQVQIEKHYPDTQQKCVERRNLLREQVPRITALVEHMKEVRLDSTTRADQIEKDASSSLDYNFKVGNETHKMIAVLGEGGQGSAYLVSHHIIITDGAKIATSVNILKLRD